MNWTLDIHMYTNQNKALQCDAFLSKPNQTKPLNSSHMVMALSSTSSLFLNTTDYSPHKPLHYLPSPSSSSSCSHFPIKPLIHHTHHTLPLSQKWRTNVSFFTSFLKKPKDASIIKEELLEAIASLDRGADATPEDQQRVDQVGCLQNL